jgi:hypothetical protein
MNEISPELLNQWNSLATYIATALVGAGILVFLYHFARLISIKEQKDKYDYINTSEIKLLWYAALLIIIGAAVYSNTLVEKSGYLWFFVRIFISSMMGIIVGVIVQNVLKFYYPFFIEKRLKKLRYSSRISPDGKKMRLLSEEEEDKYLDEGMQAEENAFSVDYDVWIEEASGYIKIEKYNGRLHALKCTECNYQTLKISKEEIVVEPTTEAEGEMIKHLTCGYCGHKERKNVRLSRVREDQGAEA